MKILLSNNQFARVTDRFSELLPEHEFGTCPVDQVHSHIDDVDILLPSTARVDASVIERGKFGFIQQLGTGLDKVDIDAATESGVLVANCPGAPSGIAESVSEHAVMMMLALTRKLPQAMENVKQGVFYKPFSRTLRGKCVTIVGLGDIGEALALRLKPFKMRIIGARRNPDHGAPDGVEKLFSMQEIKLALGEADFVVLAVPDNPSTHKLINSETLAAMKRGSYLINVARGGLVDEDALLSALQSGHLAGAGLDVFDEEPCATDHPLFEQNVIATPHTAGNTDASFNGVIEIIVENIRRYAQGSQPLYTVNTPRALRTSRA